MFFIIYILAQYIISVMRAFFSFITDYNSRKILFFAVWLLTSIKINLFWITKPKVQSYLSIPMSQLSYVNIFVTIICLEVEIIWTISTEWPTTDLICKITKWLQTASVMLSVGLIFQIIYLFRFPSENRKRIKKNVVLIWIASLLFAAPQVRFQII